jgi:hypothetical protein
VIETAPRRARCTSRVRLLPVRIFKTDFDEWPQAGLLIDNEVSLAAKPKNASLQTGQNEPGEG